MKIIIETKKCIGCGSCVAVCPDYFELGDDGKAKLNGGKNEGNSNVLHTNKEGCSREAIEICPVECIKIG